MFGLGKRKGDDGKLPVFVHAMQSPAAFALAQKVWQVNARLVRRDPANRKEFIHFAYTKPSCAVWLQHDTGRGDTFELVLRWEEDAATEVYTIGAGTPAGDDQRAKDVLNRMLTIPSVLPAGSEQV